ncbi:GNAT family N-acetyltransferase [Parablastomonas sp. CN1-191]|uniref:GNAT family N-acetyltransferase n=1 Tax=Parablastomonas sp. CN1-191 TaxID=3400908 RepID=UPI003BF8A473
MDEFLIVRIGPADADRLVDVAAGVFNDPIDAALLAAYLADPGTVLVVACENGRVIGQAMGALHRHPDKPSDLYVDEVAVSPDHRRRGIARALLAELEACARELGCADIWLATERGNDGARAWYGSFAEAKDCVLYFWDL